MSAYIDGLLKQVEPSAYQEASAMTDRLGGDPKTVEAMGGPVRAMQLLEVVQAAVFIALEESCAYGEALQKAQDNTGLTLTKTEIPRALFACLHATNEIMGDF